MLSVHRLLQLSLAKAQDRIDRSYLGAQYVLISLYVISTVGARVIVTDPQDLNTILARQGQFTITSPTQRRQQLPHRTRGHTAGHVNDSKTELSDIYPTAYDMRAAARRIDSITGRGW